MKDRIEWRDLLQKIEITLLQKEKKNFVHWTFITDGLLYWLKKILDINNFAVG